MKCTLLLILTCSICSAQEYPHRDIDLSRLTDEIFAMQDEDLNYEELQESVAQILLHPIDVNTATEEDLRFLSVLSEDQIQALLRYRVECGLLLSIYELQAIPRFDPETIYKVVPFLSVDDRANDLEGLFRRIISEKNNYFITRYERVLEKQRGYKDSTENRFRGSAEKVYVRFRVSRPHDFSIGFSAEKDAGEQFAWNTKQNHFAFDFWSGHIQLQNKGRLKNLIIGDFQSQFGQGLVLGGSFGTGKGAETVMSVRRTNIGFVPYTSANESVFNRGIATTITIRKNIFLSGFYSSLFQDGVLGVDSASLIISSLQSSGLHRTNSELEKENVIREQQAGSVITLKKRGLETGLIYHRMWYNAPFERAPSVYNQFHFRGRSLQNVSAFVNFSYANFTFFTEAAQTIDHGTSLVAGTIGSMGRNVDVSLLYRNYARNFHSLNSNAFAENSAPQNETGLYWGWKYRFSRKYNIASYVDLFRFPWLRFRSYAPSAGHEYLVRFNYQPTRQTIMFIQFREEKKLRNTSSDGRLYSTSNALKRNYILCADYSLAQNIRMKTRAQFSTLNSETIASDGFMISQDLSVGIRRWQWTARYALFQSDDFDNRQYVFENDVWLAYSLQAYYGAGVRTYLLVEYKVNRHISLWLRWSRTRYTIQEKIGSGHDEIEGNKRNDVKFQVRFKL